LKSCIYGYGEQSLDDLDSYLIEGNIDLVEMNQEQTVILHMAVDGLDNPQLDFKVGDKIKIRFLENTKIDDNSVKMPDNLNYIEKEFVIGGIVSHIKDKYDYYGNGEADIIFSSQAFNNIMGYENMSLISANAAENANHTQIVNQISKIVEDVPKCTVRDMSAQVNEMNSYINQKLAFIYAITIILLIIGLFNIMNNVSYTLLARTNEFGIMQAIGLGYGDLRKLIMKEGIIYSLISCIITLIGSFLGQFILFILMKNSYMGVNFTINVRLYIIVIILNILIGGIATYIPSKKLHKCSIIQSINRLE
jgi:putative ABC transport system permease protein